MTEEAAGDDARWVRAQPRRKRDISVRGFVGWQWAPHVTLAVALGIVAIYAARIGARVHVFALDETLLKQSAIHDAQNLRHNLLHDPSARSTSRLYSLVLSILARIWSGDTVVRAAKVVNVLLFLSTAIPVWLLAREYLASRWRVAAAAGLSVAAPWLAISTAIYTENLAYPLFVWALVAMAWALRAPSWRRDLVVVATMVALVGTRVQFASMFVVWLVIVAVVHWVATPAGDGRRSRARQTARTVIVKYPFGVAVVGLTLLYALSLVFAGTLHSTLQADLGRYSEIQDRAGITPDFLPSLLVEVVNFAVGTGVLPVVAGLAWWTAMLGRRREDTHQWNVTVVAVTAGVGTTLATLYVQGGYLGAHTEERYYLYLVPLVWIGALGAIGAPWLRRSWLAIAGGVVVLACATMPLLDPINDHQYIFLGPAGAVVAHWAQRFMLDVVTGLSERDGVALFALAALGAGLYAWRRSRARLAVWIVIPALIQLAITLYAFAVINGQVTGVPGNVGSDFATLSFVDHNVPHGTVVTWLNTQRRPADGSAQDNQHIVQFWNQDISAVASDPALGLGGVTIPLNQFHPKPLSVDPATGVVTSAAPLRYVVQPAGSPFLQIGGARTLGSTPLGFVLSAAGVPAAATWLAVGLKPDGTVPVAPPARLRTWGEGEIRVTMQFVANGATPATLALTFGRHAHRIAVPADAIGHTIMVDAGCASLGHPVTGTLRSVAGSAALLAVTPAVTGAC